jgi:hypothetical protein
MFSDIAEGVLDRLAKSIQLQAMTFSFRDYRSEKSKLLEKMTNLQGLRAVSLHHSLEDWSILTRLDSLRTLTLCNCRLGLLDNSPFMEGLSREHDIEAVGLQEWKRSDSEHKFQLTKLRLYELIDHKICQLLPLETHLEMFGFLSGNWSLLDELPSCQSIRSLEITNIRSNEDIAALSRALLLAPFVQSLTLETSPPRNRHDFSSLPLSALKSFKLTAKGSTVESVSQALTNSKPNSLTSLELYYLRGSCEPLALAFSECPSLTHLSVHEEGPFDLEILPLVRMLYRLPLVKLNLDLYHYDDESFEGLLSCLSRCAVQDCKLGTLTPKQLQMVADVLSSLSCLQSLEFDTVNFRLCAHESSQLPFFSALPRSSLRSLTFRFGSFRLPVFEACLSSIPATSLTQFHLPNPKVLAEGFDPTMHDNTYKQVELGDSIDWNTRFPTTKDKFCCMSQ